MAHESFEDDRGRRGDERRVRVHQGRPRGAARPRRGVHERDRRADRAGRLADDVLPHPRRPAVLLRHLLPESRTSCSCSPRSPRPGAPGAARWSRPPTRSPASCGRWRSGCPAVGRRCSRHCATTPSPRVLRDEDVERGGFGGAPKFPPSALLGSAAAQPRTHRRHRCRWRRSSAPARRWPAAASTTSWPAASPATASTPPGWCRTSRRCSTTTRCCCGCTRTGRVAPANPLARKVAGETARFMIDELGAGGMFTSSLDADADGREGLTYVWTPAQLREVLGDDDGRWAAELFGVTDGGYVRARQLGAATARRPRRSPSGSSGSAPRCWPPGSTRPQPGRDDKVVTAWNGLAITALAEASVALDRPEFLDAATQCARSIARPAHRRRPAASGQPRRPRRRQRRDPRGPRDAGDRAADAVPAHRRRVAGWTRPPACSTSRSTTSPTPTAPAAGSTPPTTPSS